MGNKPSELDQQFLRKESDYPVPAEARYTLPPALVRASSKDLIRRLRKMASNGELSGSTQATGAKQGLVSQWVSRVRAYSSQYDSDSWNADQVIGSPRVYPQYGDIVGTWAPGDRNNSEFLETYHAGGTKAVLGKTADGRWVPLYTAPSIENITSSRIFSPPLNEQSLKTRELRIEVDCTVAGTWVEIDAVQLHGRRFLLAPPPSMSDMASDLEKLINDERFSDCSFTVEGKTVYAHRAILCVRSDYFRALFADHTKESKSKEPIVIPDVSYPNFLAVLHFLYTNQLPDTLDTIALTNLWRVADRFSMDGLKALAALQVCEKINTENVVDTFVCANNNLPIIVDPHWNSSSELSRVVFSLNLLEGVAPGACTLGEGPRGWAGGLTASPSPWALSWRLGGGSLVAAPFWCGLRPRDWYWSYDHLPELPPPLES
ncbi:SPOPL-like protein [Mya arenaria]|uniref:SPOPL-like protein n=1 Tax=Mya arenaria TaxID=6604 RepID=A0ABY7DG22_MYAAR|nr:SPOPL-like protein [Mya arenaria]